jgi:hypothetical protein
MLEMLRAKCDVIQLESYILLLRMCSLISFLIAQVDFR